MKTITVPCLLQFDAIGPTSDADQAMRVRELVNQALVESGINSQPAILPSEPAPSLAPVVRNLVLWLYAIREHHEALVIAATPEGFSLTEAIEAVEATQAAPFWRDGDHDLIVKLASETKQAPAAALFATMPTSPFNGYIARPRELSFIADPENVTAALWQRANRLLTSANGNPTGGLFSPGSTKTAIATTEQGAIDRLREQLGRTLRSHLGTGYVAAHWRFTVCTGAVTDGLFWDDPQTYTSGEHEPL